MRETGPIRKGLSGDPADPSSTEATAPYIGLARTLLGQLKTRMQLGGIDHLSRTVNLPDGTTIQVMSTNGQDTIRIAAAGVVVPTVQEAPISQSENASEEAEFTQLFADVNAQEIILVGADAQGGFWWSKAKGRLVVNTLGYQYAIPNGVSGDGLHVAGSCENTGSPATSQAFVWTRASGTVGLGILPGAVQQNSYANAISFDSKTVVGQSIDITGGLHPMHWTQRAGMIGMGPFNPAKPTLGGSANAVSANGQVIGGFAAVDDATTAKTPWMWAAGSYTDLGDFGLGLTGDDKQGTVTGVSGNGKVLVGGSGIAHSILAPFYWTAKTGLVRISGPDSSSTSSATAISMDGSTIVGYHAGGARAFYWTKTKGFVDLGPGLATSVSSDGGVIAGFNASTGFAQYWSKKGRVTPAMSVPLFTVLSPTGVAAPKTTFKV